MSVMEMSHRSKDFQDILKEAEQDLRDLMEIPDNYKVLFIQGGGHMQFAMVPMNLMKNKVGDYIITGQWAKKAFKEAQMYGTAHAMLPARIKPSAIFRTAPIFRWTRTQTTYTSA